MGVNKNSINSFDLIVNKLVEAYNILDKEIILGIYYDLYNSIITFLLMNDTYNIEQYQEYLVRTMLNVIKLSKGRSDIVTCESFLGNLFYYLNVNELSRDNVVSSVIKSFKTRFYKLINDNKRIVNNINLVYKDICFIDRIRIIIRYKNYINDLMVRFIKNYDINNAYNLSNILDDYLNYKLFDIMSVCYNLDDFERMLKLYTKDKFKDMYDKGEYDFFNINSGFIYELMQKFDDIESNFFKLYFFYKLAGFNAIDFEKIEINTQTLSEELEMDISTCSRCLKQMTKKANMLRIKKIFRFNK